MSWCTVESDPGVFTELIERFGVKGVHFREFYSMDDDSFQSHQPLHGLVFLFRWTKAQAAAPAEDSGTRYYESDGEVYFAKQVIDNACGTLALLHILLNAEGRIDIGYKGFTGSFPPQLAGEALNMQPDIRIAHNSFARPEPFVYEKAKATDDDDVYHFIAYVPVGNKVFELDGLKRAPVLLGEFEDDAQWYKLARDAINARISKSDATELRWALMGLRDNEGPKAAKELARAEARLAAVMRAQGGGDDADVDMGKTEDEEDADMTDDFTVATGADELEMQRMNLADTVTTLKGSIEAEKALFAKWKSENVRRRHNYIPLAVELLKVLAERKELMPLLEAGKKKAAEARERAIQREKDRAAAKAKAKEATAAGSDGADATPAS